MIHWPNAPAEKEQKTAANDQEKQNVQGEDDVSQEAKEGKKSREVGEGKLEAGEDLHEAQRASEETVSAPGKRHRAGNS